MKKRIIYRLFASALCCSLFFSNRVIYAADETVANQFVSQYDEEPQDATDESSDNLENVEELEQNTESSTTETNNVDVVDDSSDDTETDTENTDAVIEESEEEQDDDPQITEELEEKTDIKAVKKDAVELRADSATAPEKVWIAPSDINGIPSQIDGFKRGENYELYMPGNVDLSTCYLVWDGGATVTIGGDSKTYVSGSCPIPSRNETKTFTFKNGNTTLTSFTVTTYQGSPNVQRVFIEIDESQGSIAAMNENKENSCTGAIYLNGVEYVLKTMKGRGNASWTESQDKKPYNLTIVTIGSDGKEKKIAFPGISSKSKKWSFLAEVLDHSLLCNRTGFYLANELKIGQETTSADVWMNGEYIGCYTVTPKTDSFVSDDGYMVEQDNYLEPEIGGDPQFPLDGLNESSGWTSAYNRITVKKMGDNFAKDDYPITNVTNKHRNMTKAAQDIHDWLQLAWDAILSDTGYNTEGHYYTDYIDIESFAKMYLMHEYVKSYDVCAGSIYFYRDGTGENDKLFAGPLWDLDNAMGSVYRNDALGQADDRQIGDRRSGEGAFISLVREYKTSIFKTLSKHPDFMDEVYYQYSIHYDLFDKLPTDCQNMINEIKDSALMNHHKVEDLGNSTGKNNHYYGSNTTLGSGQYKQTYLATTNSKQDWENYAMNLKTYITTRSLWFKNNWKKELIYITFDANEGAGSMEQQSTISGRKTPLEQNEFTRTGYTFAGWNTKANGTGTAYTDQQAITISSGTTLYAQWNLNEYTVTFDADNGSSPLVQTVSFGNHAVKPQDNPTKQGFDFYGWHLVTDPETGEIEGKSFDFTNTQITQDIRLKALWISSDAIVVNGSTLELNGTINVNFFVHIPEYMIDELTATAVVNGRRIDIKGKDANHRETNLFVFSVPVPAAEIRDMVNFKLVGQNGAVLPMLNSEGKDITETGFESSVYQYLSKDKTGDKLIALCDALDRYGSYAEAFFKHNDDPAHLENKEITAAEEAEVKTKVENSVPTSEGSVPGLTYESSTLVLEGKTAIRMYFTVAPDHNIGEYAFKVGQTELTPFPRNGMYYVEVKNVPAAELSDPVSLTVTDTDGSAQFTINYSVLSYIRNKLNSENEDEELLRKLCSALFLYGEAAEKYFEAQR